MHVPMPESTTSAASRHVKAFWLRLAMMPSIWPEDKKREHTARHNTSNTNHVHTEHQPRRRRRQARQRPHCGTVHLVHTNQDAEQLGLPQPLSYRRSRSAPGGCRRAGPSAVERDLRSRSHSAHHTLHSASPRAHHRRPSAGKQQLDHELWTSEQGCPRFVWHNGVKDPVSGENLEKLQYKRAAP